jgi:hypothetical protein
MGDLGVNAYLLIYFKTYRFLLLQKQSQIIVEVIVEINF